MRAALDEVVADELAVAQHGEAVADLVDLVEEVRDEEDRDALLLERADDAEELGDLVGVEARGGLVEDEQLRLHVDGAGDRHELLHGERVVAEQRPRVEVEVEAREQLGGRRRMARQSIDPSRRGSRPSMMFSATDRFGSRFTAST